MKLTTGRRFSVSHEEAHCLFDMLRLVFERHRINLKRKVTVATRNGSRITFNVPDFVAMDAARGEPNNTPTVASADTAATTNAEVNEGSSESGEGGSGDDGGEDSGDGDDDPPTSGTFGAEEPDWCNWLFLLALWLYSLLPDFVVLMRRFDHVFPDDIHDTHYTPGKQRLLQEICRYAERDHPAGLRLWRGFWWRVRWLHLTAACFKRWACCWLPSPKGG